MPQIPSFFVRSAWWHYKIPPPIMLLTLLLAHRTDFFGLVVALSSEIAVIALVCNFGYAVNEIFDVEEDARAGRSNIASVTGIYRIAIVAALSAALSVVLAWFAFGIAGVPLTAGALLISLAYSAPPVRLKDRRWLGVVADASAAHLYPALLCFVIASQFRAPEFPIVAASIAWSLALGTRGILLHQLLDDDLDRTAGLTTVVHIHGRKRIIGLIKFGVAPLEIGALLALCWLLEPGPAFWAVIVVYALVEQGKVLSGVRGVLFSSSGGRHVPFLNNSIYEVWGPLAALIAASSTEPAVLILVAVYVVLFWRRVFAEFRASVGMALRLATALGAWSGRRRYGR
jgi:hypothetical protein